GQPDVQARRVIEATGTDYVDLRDGGDVDTSMFADLVHMNVDGRAIYTRLLADALTPVLGPGPSEAGAAFAAGGAGEELSLARLREPVGPGGGEGPELLVGGDRHGAEVRVRVAEPVRRPGHLAVLRVVHDLPPEPLLGELVVADAEVPVARLDLALEPREHLDERVATLAGDAAHDLPDAVVLLVHAVARVVDGV